MTTVRIPFVWCYGMIRQCGLIYETVLPKKYKSISFRLVLLLPETRLAINNTNTQRIPVFRWVFDLGFHLPLPCLSLLCLSVSRTNCCLSILMLHRASISSWQPGDTTHTQHGGNVDVGAAATQLAILPAGLHGVHTSIHCLNEHTHMHTHTQEQGSSFSSPGHNTPCSATPAATPVAEPDFYSTHSRDANRCEKPTLNCLMFSLCNWHNSKWLTSGQHQLFMMILYVALKRTTHTYRTYL